MIGSLLNEGTGNMEEEQHESMGNSNDKRERGRFIPDLNHCIEKKAAKHIDRAGE